MDWGCNQFATIQINTERINRHACSGLKINSHLSVNISSQTMCNHRRIPHVTKHTDMECCLYVTDFILCLLCFLVCTLSQKRCSFVISFRPHAGQPLAEHNATSSFQKTNYHRVRVHTNYYYTFPTAVKVSSLYKCVHSLMTLYHNHRIDL
jgi:hypothetical protein